MSFLSIDPVIASYENLLIKTHEGPEPPEFSEIYLRLAFKDVFGKGYNIDLNLIPLRNQVKLICFSKVITDLKELAKKTQISESYIRLIISQQDSIMDRWRKACGKTQLEKEPAVPTHGNEEAEVIDTLLFEWCKRAFWNDNKEIDEFVIQQQANEMKLMLHVPTYQIRPDFWNQFKEFKTRHDDNMYRGTMFFSLDVEQILSHCQDRIEPFAYKKFMAILQKGRPQTNQLRTYARRKKTKICEKPTSNVLSVERSTEKVVTTSKTDYVKVKNEPIYDDEMAVETTADLSKSHTSLDFRKIMESCDNSDIVSNHSFTPQVGVSNDATEPEIADIHAEHEAIDQLLVEWTKRFIIRDVSGMNRSEIEYKANEFRQRFKVPTYMIYENFWHDLVEFMTLKLRKLRERQGQNCSLDTENILNNCKNRMSLKTYTKFMSRLKNAGKTTRHHQLSSSYKIPRKSAERQVFTAIKVEGIDTNDGITTVNGTLVKTETVDQGSIKVKQEPKSCLANNSDVAETMFSIEFIGSSDDDDNIVVKTEQYANDIIKEFTKLPVDSSMAEPGLDSGFKEFKTKVKEEPISTDKNCDDTEKLSFQLIYSSEANNDIVLIETPVQCIDVTQDIFDNTNINEQNETSIRIKIEPDSSESIPIIEPTSLEQNPLNISKTGTKQLSSVALNLNTNGNDETAATNSTLSEPVSPLVVQWAKQCISNCGKPNEQFDDVLTQANKLKLCTSSNKGVVYNLVQVDDGNDECDLNDDDLSITIAFKGRGKNGQDTSDFHEDPSFSSTLNVAFKEDNHSQSVDDDDCEATQGRSTLINVCNNAKEYRHNKNSFLDPDSEAASEFRFKRTLEEPEEVRHNIKKRHGNEKRLTISETITLSPPLDIKCNQIQKEHAADKLIDEEEFSLDLVKHEEFIDCEAESCSNEAVQQMENNCFTTAQLINVNEREYNDYKMEENEDDVYITIVDVDHDDDDDCTISAYSCHKCSKVFKKHSQMSVHKCPTDMPIFQCKNCLKTLYGLENFTFHLAECEYVKYSKASSALESQNDIATTKTLKKAKANDRFCVPCQIFVPWSVFKTHQRESLHRANSAKFLKENVIKTSPPASENVQRYLIVSNLKHIFSAKVVLNNLKHFIREVLFKNIIDSRYFKYNITLCGNYVRNFENHKMLATMKNFTSTFKSVRDIAEIDHSIIESFQELTSLSSDLTNWSIVDFQHIELNVCKLENIPVGSDMILPNETAWKKYTLDIENSNEFCFKWCILAALALREDNLRQNDIIQLKCQSYYEIPDISSEKITFCHINIDFANMTLPIDLEDFNTFEINNPQFSVNVYELETQSGTALVKGPARRTSQIKAMHINLLKISTPTSCHFSLIHNLTELVRSQFTTSNDPGVFCDACQNFYFTDSIEHEAECSKVKTTYPKPKTFLFFDQYYRKLSPPVVMYVSMETAFRRDAGPIDVRRSEVLVVSLYVHHIYKSSLNEMYLFEGKNCIENFVKRLESRMHELCKAYRWTQLKIRKASAADITRIPCFVCDFKIRDEECCGSVNTFSGKFEGYAHMRCKRKLKFPFPFFPVVFHNLSKYIHLFIKELGDQVSAIPSDDGSYLSISKKITENGKTKFKMQFLDSRRFLNSDLETVVSSFNKLNFKLSADYYQSTEKLKVMRRRRVFPHCYLDDWDKLNENKLPARVYFYDDVTHRECSSDDYEHAQAVWKLFRCQTLGDYLAHYSKSNVLHLADKFENSRKTCLKTYKLDPCHYSSAEAFSWDAMLKYTKIKLELVSDPEIYTFLKSTIRGDIAHCSHRLSKANNADVSHYNSRIKDNYLTCLHVNGLQVCSMSQKLPYSSFSFLSAEETKKFNIFTVDPNGDMGYILEVDLEYPKESHDAHNCLPLAAAYKIPPGGEVHKLIADLTDKNNYKIHLRHLLLCLRNGLVLKKIHRVLRFSQMDWCRNYVSFNINKTKYAKNEFDKLIHKSMNDALFRAMTRETDELQSEFRFIAYNESYHKSEECRALIGRDNFHAIDIFDSGAYGIHLEELEVHRSKPLYLAASVLELNKFLLYDLYYDCLCTLNTNIQLLYMNPDIFVLSSVQKLNEILKYQDWVDFESSHETVAYFAGLNSNAFIYVRQGDEQKNLAEELVERAENIDMCHYVVNGNNFHAAQRVIPNISQNLLTKIVQQINNRIYRDDKRFVLKDNLRTLAWGHYKINGCVEEGC